MSTFLDGESFRSRDALGGESFAFGEQRRLRLRRRHRRGTDRGTDSLRLRDARGRRLGLLLRLDDATSRAFEGGFHRRASRLFDVEGGAKFRLGGALLRLGGFEFARGGGGAASSASFAAATSARAVSSSAEASFAARLAACSAAAAAATSRSRLLHRR